MVNNFELLHQPQPEPIVTPAIEEFMPVMHEMVGELKGSFQNGDYGILVGDDTSGRIPTLILRGVINHINKTHEQPPIPITFVQGRYGRLSDSDSQRLAHNLQPLLALSNQKRALIVSEYMEEGEHVRTIGEVIHQVGIPYDIAAIGRLEETDYYRNQDTLRLTEEIFPKSGYLQDVPTIYGRKELTGLVRLHNTVHRDPNFSKSSVSAVREDVRKAIGQIITKQNL